MNMFFIEYENGNFVNGRLIDWICITEESIRFTLQGDTESTYKASYSNRESFINHLGAINDNRGSLEKPAAA